MPQDDQIRELMETMNKLKKMGHYRIDVSGLKRGEFSMLMCISHLEEDTGRPARVADLSTLHHTTTSAISQMLGNLEKKGMIKRRPDETDRRKVYVDITQQGREALSCAQKQFDRLLELILTKLGQKDSEKLIELLGRLYEIMEEINQAGLLDGIGENDICGK
ncbi:MarR family transcriptional regulator [Christensenellaceae bacterium OttesenSCG-928-K19]|nr:MarR family transcriptional regulator [Christensenellaceae bacterium OttesenSCG-928-K19]